MVLFPLDVTLGCFEILADELVGQTKQRLILYKSTSNLRCQIAEVADQQQVIVSVQLDRGKQFRH